MIKFGGSRPVAAVLADGRRLHLQNGPIDLIIEAEGSHRDVVAAYRQSVLAFQTVLTDLVAELDILRKPVSARRFPLRSVARRMWRATSPHGRHAFVTPMAAVAGAVADHILAAMIAGRSLQRAYVNNGGDIALFLASGKSFGIGVCDDPDSQSEAGRVRVRECDAVGGIATSGWRGRSHSLGIADAVTVLADTAANADAAATLIANAVDLSGSNRVNRTPARELSPDSDLGDRLVTVAVGALRQVDKDAALEQGLQEAERMCGLGLIRAAFLSLQGCQRTVSDIADPAPCVGARLISNQDILEMPRA